MGDLTNNAGYTKNTGTITGITMNGTSKGTSGVVDLGTVITAHQDISGKANASDVYSKTQTDTLLAGKQNTLTFDNAPTAGHTTQVMSSDAIKTALDAKANAADVPTITEMTDAIDDALGEAEVTVVPANSVGIITSLGSDSNEDALSASMGKKLKIAILQIYSSLGVYAFPNGKPNLDFDDIITYSVAKTIGTGLSASGVPTEVLSNQRLEVTIAITDNLYIIDDDSVVVTMGGSPVAGAWNASTQKVTIAAVTGNVVINVPSMTYVDVDGGNNQLAFMLDCKNRGGQDGHWIDLIGNIDFALTDATEANTGVVFNGTTSKGISAGSLNISWENATVEIVGRRENYTVDNPVLSNDVNGYVAASLRRPLGSGRKPAVFSTGSNGITSPTNMAFDVGDVLDFHISANKMRHALNGVSSDTWDSGIYDYVTGVSTSLAIGYRNIAGAETFLNGNIKAIRVYSSRLSADEMLQNYKIDKKRFNLE